MSIYHGVPSSRYSTDDLYIGYSLASTLYETGQKKPLADAVVQDTLCHCALNAFDNATNPNRTRGGLKKCDEM